MGTEKPKADLLPGTLDMLVLKTLPRGQRLELNGCIEGNWGLSANNRRARFYRARHRCGEELGSVGEKVLGKQDGRRSPSGH